MLFYLMWRINLTLYNVHATRSVVKFGVFIHKFRFHSQKIVIVISIYFIHKLSIIILTKKTIQILLRNLNFLKVAYKSRINASTAFLAFIVKNMCNFSGVYYAIFLDFLGLFLLRIQRNLLNIFHNESKSNPWIRKLLNQHIR